MKKAISLEKFKNEDEERDFWSKIDFSEYLEPADFQSASFPNLKPTSQPISIRLPKHLLVRLKERANELDVPYQSLIKKFIAQGITAK